MIHERGYWLQIDKKNAHTCDKKLCSAIIKEFSFVKSVVDIGCGDGSYTKEFLKAGINCTGYDGSPLTPQLSGGVCKVLDFSSPVDIGKFDLVLSLEVGEHIPAQFEQTFIDNLVNASKRFVVLSWAIEGQGGWGHVNCRNNDYIIREMSKRNYLFIPFTTNKLRKKCSLPWFSYTLMIFTKNGI